MTNKRNILPVAVMAAVLIILQVAALAVSTRYAYISTDILAQTEADILVAVASVLSPLTTYFRLALLICGCFFFAKRQSVPFVVCAVVSLIFGAGCDLFLSASYDAYFAGNEGLYILATALSLAVSLTATVVIIYYTGKRRNGLIDGKGKKYPLVRSFLFGAAVMFIIDTLYRTYTVFTMVFSSEGVSFKSAEDVLYLVYDYLYPLGEAALGFGFMCLVGLIFKKSLTKNTDVHNN